MIEYALVAMTMMAGTAAARHLVGQSGAGTIADAVAVLDDAAATARSFGDGDANGGGRRGSAASGGDESSGATSGGRSDGSRAKRREPRRQGTEPRAIVTLEDDGRSAP